MKTTMPMRALMAILLAGVSTLAQAQLTWTAAKSGIKDDINACTWAGNQFIAIGTGDVSQPVLASQDGIRWTSKTAIPASNWITSSAWNGSELIGVGDNGGGTSLIMTKDFKTWYAHSLLDEFFSIVWTGKNFVAVGSKSAVSPNGTSWKIGATPAALNALAWNGKVFVAVGIQKAIASSTDGIHWTARVKQDPKSASNFTAVAWSGKLFVAVGTDLVATSPDGAKWTIQKTKASSNYLSAVVWAGGQFVASGDNGTIATSPNGVTWTARKSGTKQNLATLATNGKVVVALGQSGTILVSSIAPKAAAAAAMAVDSTGFDSPMVSAPQVAPVQLGLTLTQAPGHLIANLPDATLDRQANVVVYSITGRKLTEARYNTNNGRIEIPTASLERGSYVLDIVSGGNHFAQTFAIGR